MTTSIAKLNASDADFLAELDKLIAWEGVSNKDVEQTVTEILRQVRTQGDAALIEYSNRFDRRDGKSMDEFCLGAEQLQVALDSIDSQTRVALETAASRIRDYHSHQLQESWQYKEADGTIELSSLSGAGTIIMTSSTPATRAGIEFISTDEG